MKSKDTKDHEGTPGCFPSCIFVPFMVEGLWFYRKVRAAFTSSIRAGCRIIHVISSILP